MAVDAPPLARRPEPSAWSGNRGGVDELSADCVCIFAPNWLGDAVMALPAIADVRQHFARSRFVVAARSSVASLFDLVPGIDAVVTLKWRGVRSQLASFGKIRRVAPVL